MTADQEIDIKDLPQFIEKFKQEWMAEFLQRVKAKTPVATGTLRSAWQGEMHDTESFTVSNDTPYASYVEYGTVHMAPVGMLTSTLNEVDVITSTATERAAS